MRGIIKCGVMAAVAAGAVLVAGAQQTAQETFRTGVEIVRLDVSVLDKNRRPVRNLTAADFTVLDDGEGQPVIAFSAIDIPDPIEHSARWMRDVGSDVATNRLDTRRIIAIVMDDCNTDIADSSMARTVARGVVNRLGPNDSSGVVFTFMGRSQNFTTDHRQLLAAVDSFYAKKSAPPRPGSAAAGTTPRAGGAPLACQLQGGLSRTVLQVATALQDTPEGRKAIVVISPGIPFNFSMESLQEADDIGDVMAAFQALQRANINVYTFDPSGLTPDGIVGPRLDTLRTFAESTGGRAVIATNTPEVHVPQVFVENGSYYLLGIPARKPGNRDEFRKLKVTVNRPGVEVRTRAGYFVERLPKPSGRKAAAPPPTALDKAFGSALPTGDLPLSVSVAPFAVPGSRESALAVTIGTSRPAPDRTVTEKMELRATAYEYETYRQRGTVLQTLELTSRPSAAGERRFEVPLRLPLRAGRYELRVGAESSSGAAGGVYVNADVPNFAKADLSLSGLILGTLRGAAAQSDALADLVPVVPTVRREFAVTEAPLAFVRAYQMGTRTPLPAAVTMRIVDAEGRQVFADEATLAGGRFQGDRGADYQLELSRAKLGPGDYLLSIEVKAAKRTVRREVRFRLVNVSV